MYENVIDLHIVISVLFMVIALILISRSIASLVKKLIFNKLDSILSIAFLAFMYVQLVSGVLLYFFLNPAGESNINSFEAAMRNNNLRFWAIEHVSLMLFALVLSQIGYIFLNRSRQDDKKFRNIGFFYGVSTLVVIISMAVALNNEGII
jgi:hypothetical protein